ncbi:hypothetical protein OXPF_12950 [Oxobacter pfennigii]|uniref:YgiT-type zinc finger domain protein n=1 Tax=Oxobacter pfennigii TaxID=36849 RepID=A0A0N8NTL5_9CLOT|nr:type II toxin-antitoxin system MqsA family antitoxin [Oxobacter pfennigii]KPU45168.1 hypothetical protein OXPF_12950 [Oxobacter pfennigii]
MDCIMCKANLYKGTVNHIVDADGYIIIVKNVPANVCKQCGEYYVEHEIALKLEEIVEESKRNRAEITIINFSDIAA